MTKQQVLDLLAENKALLQEQYGVTKLALFGSTARDTATDKSDVDILISFEGKATAKRYFGVLFHLEDLLNCPVDLVTENALRPELQPYIDAEKIYV
ncbi:nucleotidyltransferase family protein [[Limnothrix rosea] IAM M-220]|uniref:nucleotidyltransferase family protein n=1 Tax=[Limnothrix rosea] IAM M-220 TaxID=454133 RepID=UPI000963F9AE|nr:nucleotidyltransferase family protein [[Limnothrix rosea] IAM M-220]OKH18647.1 DNA polymerase subunit beta [[Limnothrix rosea] IAM M-220]